METIQIVDRRSLPTRNADGVSVKDLAHLILLNPLTRNRQADYHRKSFISSMKGTTKPAVWIDACGIFINSL